MVRSISYLLCLTLFQKQFDGKAQKRRTKFGFNFDKYNAIIVHSIKVNASFAAQNEICSVSLSQPIIFSISCEFYAFDLILCDALCDLVPFVQFKKREKHTWRSVTFSKVAGYSLKVKLKLLHGCFSLF